MGQEALDPAGARRADGAGLHCALSLSDWGPLTVHSATHQPVPQAAEDETDEWGSPRGPKIACRELSAGQAGGGFHIMRPSSGM